MRYRTSRHPCAMPLHKFPKIPIVFREALGMGNHLTNTPTSIDRESLAMGAIHQNGDWLREPKVRDTRRPAAEPESGRSVDRPCLQHEHRLLVLSTIIFHCRSLCSDSLMWTPSMLSFFFLQGTWLEKQAGTTKDYLSSDIGKLSVSITDHRSRSRVWASFFCTVNPVNFCLFCQPFYISRVSIFLLLFFSPL